ncbi:MAG: hypothetical protein ACE37K_08105 [Planctomycetota bacterium]
MSDANEGATPPAGAPRSLIVEGIVDGRVLDAQALREAVARLSACGAGEFRIDVTGGRFNMLPVDTHVPPEGFDSAAQSNFLDRLQELVDAAQPNSIETTLRCKLVYDDEVAETLFVVQGTTVEPVTRRRPRTVQDAPALPTMEAEASLGMRRKELLWIAPLLLVLGGVFAWQSGYIDRVLAVRAEEMNTDTGPFGDMVAMKLERSWGNYHVTLTRGAGYPTTPDALAARKQSSSDLTEQAACAVVGEGDQLFVQLLDDQGKVLEAARTELRPLLTDADGEVLVRLPGKMSVKSVRLSLSAGKKQKNK